jgi:hypothetical protein
MESSSFFLFFFDTNETSSLQEVQYNTPGENGLEMQREPEASVHRFYSSKDLGMKVLLILLAK